MSTFELKHGKKIWALMGQDWSKSESEGFLAGALLGKDAPAVAAMLGLELADVAAIIDPASVPAPVVDATPPAPDLPAVGSVWRLRRLWDCFHHVSGKGFTTAPADSEPERDALFIRCGAICRVLLAGPDELLILTDDLNMMVHIKPHLFAYLMEASA